MNLDERDTVATQFGVSPEQVERDHLISHLLAAIADRFADRVHFIGGTALARTHLPDGRLSEDIDLVALGNRNELAVELDAALERAVARTHGRLSWGPALAAVRDTEAANLRTRSVQLSRSSCCPPSTGRCGRQNLGGWNSDTAMRRRPR